MTANIVINIRIPTDRHYLPFKYKIHNRKNLNRSFRKLIVWQDSVLLYSQILEVLKKHPEIAFKTANNISEAIHSISRNIAEGYGRRSKAEYLRFLDIALGSCAEAQSETRQFKTP